MVVEGVMATEAAEVAAPGVRVVAVVAVDLVVVGAAAAVVVVAATALVKAVVRVIDLIRTVAERDGDLLRCTSQGAQWAAVQSGFDHLFWFAGTALEQLSILILIKDRARMGEVLDAWRAH
mmetsp:Transcript_18406/g.49452  ORF Transcript_18406/g.49452 Transcript_18406/m.49452 type:complete len:121 (+) Transcript_18406:356-718(+)